MRHTLWILSIFTFMTAVVVMATTPPRAHADYFQYPCNYPFIGSGADVQIIVHGGGQYCDGPTEINGSHYECRSGGGGIGGGVLGLAPLGGVNVGGFGGSGVGMNIGDCHFRCPDGEIAPTPNPPGMWVKHLVVEERYNDCREHMAPQGPDSMGQAPESGPEEGAGKPQSPVPMPGS